MSETIYWHLPQQICCIYAMVLISSSTFYRDTDNLTKIDGSTNWSILEKKLNTLWLAAKVISNYFRHNQTTTKKYASKLFKGKLKGEYLESVGYMYKTISEQFREGATERHTPARDVIHTQRGQWASLYSYETVLWVLSISKEWPWLYGVTSSHKHILQIAKFVEQTWGPPGSYRPQVGRALCWPYEPCFRDYSIRMMTNAGLGEVVSSGYEHSSISNLQINWFQT